MRKRFIIMIVSSFALLFGSCHKDSNEVDFEGDPTDIIDPDHVMLQDLYGITTVCGKGEWSNAYDDTVPPQDYYAKFRYNRISVALKQDSIPVTFPTPHVEYPSMVYFMRFHYLPSSEQDAFAFMESYRKTVYADLETAWYVDGSTTPLKQTNLGNYDAYQFRSELLGAYDGEPAFNDVYLMYYNNRIYGVTISLIPEYMKENSQAKCYEIASAVRLK